MKPEMLAAGALISWVMVRSRRSRWFMMRLISSLASSRFSR
ncbi:Uncharacterised protein [Segatella copri]|nr:Uncharacterised protein [Segatella copri]